MMNIENELISFDANSLINDSYINFEDGEHYGNMNIDLINSIVNSYSKNIIISNDVKTKILKDPIFRLELLVNIQDRMKNIILNSSTLQFKELVTVINLLSLGTNYNIFETYNEFSFDSISKIFRDYEKTLQIEFINDKKNFDITFNYYLTLLDSFNELCIINITDISRKKKINNIVELLTESINILKFSIKLDYDKISLLSTFQGKLILSFSNVLYISTKNKKINDIIDIYTFIFNKQIDGFYLINDTKINSNFHFDSLIVNSSRTLLLMFRKLNTYNEDYFDKLNEIMEIYNKYCIEAEIKYESLNEFYSKLFNNLLSFYSKDKIISSREIIDIILDKKKLLHEDIITLHDIVLFDYELSDSLLELILNKLLTFEKVKNDYYENYKLKIIDLILNKYIESKSKFDLELIISNIIIYINNKDIAIHLMSSYSKIHLTLSHYYSILDCNHIYTSKKHYFMSEKICSYTLIREEFKNIYKTILLNNFNNYFVQKDIKNQFNNEESLILSEQRMIDFFKNEEILIRYNLSEYVSSLTQEILTDKLFDTEDFEKRISTMISEKIFFGLCKCKIINKLENFDSSYEFGYEIVEDNLINSYSIVYIFSYSYKLTFDSIYKKNESYIKSNLNNLLLSYSMIKLSKDYYSNYLYENELITL